MFVRDARPEDVDRILVLLAQLGYTRDRSDLEAELSATPGSLVIVVEDEGLVVGAIAVHVRRQLHLPAPVANVDALVVDESRRSHGRGSMLLGAACEWAAASGAHRIELSSGVDRTDARRFYERHGFEVVSNHFRRTL